MSVTHAWHAFLQYVADVIRTAAQQETIINQFPNYMADVDFWKLFFCLDLPTPKRHEELERTVVKVLAQYAQVCCCHCLLNRFVAPVVLLFCAFLSSFFFVFGISWLCLIAG